MIRGVLKGVFLLGQWLLGSFWAPTKAEPPPLDKFLNTPLIMKILKIFIYFIYYTFQISVPTEQ